MVDDDAHVVLLTCLQLGLKTPRILSSPIPSSSLLFISLLLPFLFYNLKQALIISSSDL